MLVRITKRPPTPLLPPLPLVQAPRPGDCPHLRVLAILVTNDLTSNREPDPQWPREGNGESHNREHYIRAVLSLFQRTNIGGDNLHLVPYRPAHFLSVLFSMPSQKKPHGVVTVGNSLLRIISHTCRI